ALARAAAAPWYDGMSELQSHLRYHSALVSITDVCCRPTTGRLGHEEQTKVPEMMFSRAGTFVRHIGQRQTVANPNHVLFFNANEPYRVSHPVAGGDDCTCFAFSI